MYEWVAELRPDQRILDIGAGTGSLRDYDVKCTVIAIDSDVDAFARAYASANTRYVFAKGGALPFPPASFDLVLCHHVLEHIENPTSTLAEIARVLTPEGRIYVAVPNGHGLCDGIYRYVFDGGEHVNRFQKDELVTLIERMARVRLVCHQDLYSSFVYLSRLPELRNPSLRHGPHLARLVNTPQWMIRWAQSGLYWLTRAAGRVAKVDWALYGWAFYFARGEVRVPEHAAFMNVCMYCGAGHPASALERISRWQYRCPSCSAATAYFPPHAGVL
jgi:SAM-dependent methyltransferase